MTKLFLVPEGEEPTPASKATVAPNLDSKTSGLLAASNHWIVMKRKVEPTTRTEVVIKLEDGKTRHLFMTKAGEEEEEITHLFNVYDKRVFDLVFRKLQTKNL